MELIIKIASIIFVVLFQRLAGYMGNKFLGAILPVLFTGFVFYMFISRNLSFSFRDIFMPLVGILVLLGMYVDGSEYKKKKLARELEKMKAKDHIQQ